MKLIIGVGNPGSEYVQTRHNLGFMVLDSFANEHNLSFSEKNKFKAFIAEGSIHGEKVLLAKPTTFYNLVGESFRAIIDFYKLAPSDVLIVHDELALPFGTMRVREGGSDAGNNGVKSINQHGGGTTMRLRLGIQTELNDRMHDSEFVLARLTKDEQTIVTETTLATAHHMIMNFINDQLAATSKKIL